MVTMATWWIFGKWGELAALGTPGEPPPSQGPGPGAPGTQGFQCQLEALLPTFVARILAELTAAFAQPGSPPARDLSRGKAG